MGVEHLQELEKALLKKGWSILTRESKVDWRTAGIWTIQRSSRVGPFHLEFCAMDHLGSNTVRDLPSAWDCCLAEQDRIDLYFSKLRNFSPKLSQFIDDLDAFETEALNMKKGA
jgi:hypothetical protein